MPSVALESLAPAGEGLSSHQLQVTSCRSARPVVPMSSISPSHNEPPMWAQRLSLDMRQLVVIHSGLAAFPATHTDACKAPKRRAHLCVGRRPPAHSCSLLLLAPPPQNKGELRSRINSGQLLPSSCTYTVQEAKAKTLLSSARENIRSTGPQKSQAKFGMQLGISCSSSIIFDSPSTSLLMYIRGSTSFP